MTCRRKLCVLLVLCVVFTVIVYYICLKEEPSAQPGSSKHLRNFNVVPPVQNVGSNHNRPVLAPASLNAPLLDHADDFEHALVGAIENIQGYQREELSVTVTAGDEGRGMEAASKRSLEYCNPPQDQPSSDEGVAPDEFSLLAVHAVIRHGDRSPMYKLPNQDSPTLSCLLDQSQAGSHQHLVQSFLNQVRLYGNQVPHNHKFGLYPQHKTCLGAQLTGKGTIQQLVNGDTLRKAYGAFTRNLQPSDVQVHTTDYSRTYQSALAFIHGLVPQVDLWQVKLHINNNINFCDERRSGLDCSCPVIGRLREFAKKEEMKMKSNLTSVLMTSIKEEVGQIYSLNTHQVPWIGGIVEVLMGYTCHQLPLPCGRGTSSRRCITPGLVSRMWQYLDARGEILLSGHAEKKYNLLVMYPFLTEISQATTNETMGSKFTLYSGHDLTVTPLAKALGIHDGHWPPYASRLLIELYSSTDSQRYIRVLYNGRNKTSRLKFCKSSDLYRGLCPLRNFVNFINSELQNVFGKNRYSQICDM